MGNKMGFTSFINYFENKLLEAEAEIIDRVDADALNSYKKRKQKPQKVPDKSKLNVFEIPSKIRDMGVKIKHYKPMEDKIELQLFNPADVLLVTKFLKTNNIKNFEINEDGLEVIIRV